MLSINFRIDILTAPAKIEKRYDGQPLAKPQQMNV